MVSAGATNAVACIFAAVAMLSIALSAAADAHAQSAAGFPGRSVRFVVPFAAGGPSDLLARTFGQKLSELWGQPVVIENRGGANGIVGTEIVAKAPADGRTLLLGTSGTHGINSSLFPKLSYDAIRDFAPITRLGQVPFILVSHPLLPARSVKEVLQLARSRPGEIACSAGGSPSQLAAELFKSMSRVKLLVVPYKGAAPALNDVLAGHVYLTFGGPAIAMPHVKAGRLRALGVTGAQRSSTAPGVPTIAESGVPGYEVLTWYGVLAPGGTPPAIVEQLNAAFVKAAQTAEVKERVAALTFEPLADTPAEFSAIVAAEVKKWVKVVKEAGVKADGA
ncbi:MAG: tripartite tricarboxylate transporter substrate binding protein [Burkholderiales bacterium]